MGTVDFFTQLVAYVRNCPYIAPKLKTRVKVRCKSHHSGMYRMKIKSLSCLRYKTRKELEKYKCIHCDDKVPFTITDNGMPVNLSKAAKVEYIFKESISGKVIIKEAEIVDDMEGKVKVKFPKQMLSTEKWSLQFKIDMGKTIFFSGLTKFGLNKGG